MLGVRPRLQRKNVSMLTPRTQADTRFSSEIESRNVQHLSLVQAYR